MNDIEILKEKIAKLNQELHSVKLENKKLHRNAYTMAIDIQTLNHDLADAHATLKMRFSKRLKNAILRRFKNLILKSPKLTKLVLKFKNYLQKPTLLPPSKEQLQAEQDYQRAKQADAKTLVFISPLPPAKSGIADYSLALLQNLKEYYDITVVCQDEQMLNSEFLKPFKTTTAQEYYQNGNISNRHLYHFGNSNHHHWIEPLLERFSGTIVLHDTFLSGYIYSKFSTHGVTALLRELFKEEGYNALKYYMDTDLHQTLMNYPLNKTLISLSDGVIVHSDYALKTVGTYTNALKVPFPKKAQEHLTTKQNAKKSLNIDETDFIISSFGFISAIKCTKELIEAFKQSPLSKNPKITLLFVGDFIQIQYGEMLKTIAKNLNIKFVGYTDEEQYKAYLQASDLVVQLRKDSKGESSAALFDALSFSKPLIINKNGSLSEIPQSVAYAISDDFSKSELADALSKLYSEQHLREELSQNALSYIKEFHDPLLSAKMYHQAIEIFHTSGYYANYKKALLMEELSHEQLQHLRKPKRQKRLFVDVSDVANHDLRTGIQRVVRSIFSYMLQDHNATCRIEPIRLVDKNYFHAHNFMAQFLNLPFSPLPDEVAQMHQGDIFLGLDLFVGHLGANPQILQNIKSKGVDIHFVIYDILPLRFPHFFPPKTHIQFEAWLDIITKTASGVACISNAVADDLKLWLKEKNIKPQSHFEISSFHLGYDIQNSIPTKGITKEEQELLNSIPHPSILMVGTIEPRKGHLQALEAMELLWSQNEALSLLIVGKQGWMVEPLIEKLQNHPQKNKKLFWFNQASDELLEILYKKASLLLAASYGEGFGLPLIEAAQKGIPVLARDIPVFREVGEKYAHFFTAQTPKELKSAIKESLSKKDKNLKTINYYTWQQSAAELVAIIKGDQS